MEEDPDEMEEEEDGEVFEGESGERSSIFSSIFRKCLSERSFESTKGVDQVQRKLK